MADRLVSLLRYFELRGKVFQAGPLAHPARFDAGDGLGYIHVIRSGSLTIETAERPPLHPSEPTLVLYMNPLTHRLLPTAGSVDLVCASFEFGAGLRNPLARALPDPVAIPLLDAPALEATLALLFREATEEHCGRQAVLDRLIEIVIIQVLRDLMDARRLQSGLLAGLAEPRLAKALNAVHADPSRSWSLARLAATAGMSRARFAAHFREVVGQTPMAYVGELRVGLAQSLLNKGKPVQLVADVVGYGSASALSRAFRARTGTTPTDWARRAAAG